jgi:predicted nucleic acid-binding protein
VIVADTGVVVALLDRSERRHEDVKALFAENLDRWLLPWAILPEVDYLVTTHVGKKAADLFLADLAAGVYEVEWGQHADVVRAAELDRQHSALGLGLVDAVVMAVAERVKASAIATFDRRHFGAVTLRGRPVLVPDPTA